MTLEEIEREVRDAAGALIEEGRSGRHAVYHPSFRKRLGRSLLAAANALGEHIQRGSHILTDEGGEE